MMVGEWKTQLRFPKRNVYDMNKQIHSQFHIPPTRFRVSEVAESVSLFQTCMIFFFFAKHKEKC